MSFKRLEWARFGASTVVACVGLTFLAQGAVGSNQEAPARADLCEDLYSVACLNADGSDKKDPDQNSPEQLAAVKAINDARDKGARAYGAPNFFDGLVAELKKNGLELAMPLEPRVKEKLLESGKIEDNINTLVAGKACLAESLQLENEAPLNATPATADAFVAKVRSVVEGQRKLTVQLYAKDLPSFINHLASDCMIADQDEVGDDKNEQAKKLEACKKLPELKRQAALLTREDSDSAAYQQRAASFVQANLEREDLQFGIKTPVVDDSLSGFAPSSRTSEMGEAKNRTRATSVLDSRTEPDQRVANAKTRLRRTCADPNTATNAAAAKIFGDYAAKIARAKPTIESLQTSIYSEARRQKVQTLISETRADLDDIISQIVPDASKRAKIQSGYDSLKLEWMEAPRASVYSKDASGQLSLDSEKYQRAAQESGQPSNIDVDQLTADPTLSGFKTSNAFYNPDRKGPAIHYAESIEIGPGFLPYAESNPDALRALIGHELGHRIGAQRGLSNGFDLKNEYAALLACYADTKSIRMQPSERDETISDYLASEMLARRLSRLPRQERRSTVVRAMAPLCDDSNFEVSEGPRSIHPRSEFRIAGVFGASPNLRSALGCEGAPKDFKVCGLPNQISEFALKRVAPATPKANAKPGLSSAGSAN